MITLAQIHICLECMLLIEAHVNCPIENLQGLFAYAYKEFVSAQSPLQHYPELCSRIFTLTVPLSNALANELNEMYVMLYDSTVRIFKKHLCACGIIQNCTTKHTAYLFQESLCMESLCFVSFCRVDANDYYLLQQTAYFSNKYIFYW